MPVPLLAIASLVSQIPSFYKLFKDDAPPAVLEKVAAIASSITGEANPEKAVEVLNANPDKMLEFKNAAENRAVEIIKIYLDDLSSARTRDAEITRIKGSNRRADALAFAAISGVIICLGVAVWNTDLNEVGKACVTLILGRCLGWVEQVFSFEFGTTKASKVKDETISELSKH